MNTSATRSLNQPPLPGPCAAPASAGHVRPFMEADIPEVADLHRRVFHTADRMTPEMLELYRVYAVQLFLENPWRGGAPESLVYEDGGGRITGFLAAMPRPMRMNERSMAGSVSSQFIVDPASRGIGVLLLQTYLNGPQEFSFADEANPTSRRIWEGLGGATALVQSMRWLYPLRPFQFGLLGVHMRKHLAPPIFHAANLAARSLDAAATWFRMNPFRCPAPRLSSEELDSETLANCLAECGGKQLRFEHDSKSIGWLVQQASRLRRFGTLIKTIVRTDKREMAGWYLYYANRGGLSEVVQLHARRRYEHDVLEHLIWNAGRQGATVLTGRVEPRWMGPLAEKRCLMMCGPEWFLFHTRNPEVRTALERGEVLYSRLDGEWPLRFR